VSTNYYFTTNWRIESTVTKVYDILSEPCDLKRWWPSVYLDVQELAPGEKNGVGKVVQLHTKGWLPYTLHWRFRVTEVNKPEGFSLEAFGDFKGTGVWTFLQDGPWVDVRYDWNIEVKKPLLRYFSWLLRPVFAANHRWAMSKGEESLRREIERLNASVNHQERT